MSETPQSTLKFRPQMLRHRQQNHWGRVLITTPAYFNWLSVGAWGLTCALFLWLSLTDFTDKRRVQGYLNTQVGVVRVYPSRVGMVDDVCVQQGDAVKRGQRLLRINTVVGGPGEESGDHERRVLDARKTALESEWRRLRDERDQWRPLLLKGYIARAEFQAKSDALLAVEKEQDQLRMAMIRHQQARRYWVRASIDGVVSSMRLTRGSPVNLLKPMLTVLPKNSMLIAELDVPVKHAGYLNVGAQVAMHYDAYVYQRFGVMKGTIQSISQSILTDADDDKPIKVGQPYYKVIVTLPQQRVRVNGQWRGLRQGMTLSAMVIGVKKTMWQWLFDPLLHDRDRFGA